MLEGLCPSLLRILSGGYMKDSFKNLLKIKSIVTLGVLAVFIYGVIKGSLGAEQIMTITSVVITFYFAKGGSADGNNSIDSEFSNKSIRDNSNSIINE